MLWKLFLLILLGACVILILEIVEGTLDRIRANKYKDVDDSQDDEETLLEDLGEWLSGAGGDEDDKNT
jgi:hypothetical protein